MGILFAVGLFPVLLGIELIVGLVTLPLCSLTGLQAGLPTSGGACNCFTFSFLQGGSGTYACDNAPTQLGNFEFTTRIFLAVPYRRPNFVISSGSRFNGFSFDVTEEDAFEFEGTVGGTCEVRFRNVTAEDRLGSYSKVCASCDVCTSTPNAFRFDCSNIVLTNGTVGGPVATTCLDFTFQDTGATTRLRH